MKGADRDRIRMAPGWVFRIERPAAPGHVTERVFRVLAAEILKGELKANALMPKEHDLADRFGVSRIAVREALHRLKSYQLVLVHHGNRTLVLDPDRADNVQLLGLESQVMSSDPDWIATFAERQLHSAAGLLALAEQRTDPQQVDLLETITDQLAQVSASDADPDGFKYTRAYWMTIALWTKNRLYLRDTAWYFKVLERNPHLQTSCMWRPEVRVAHHRRINARLRERRGTAAAYLEMVRDLRLRTKEGERRKVSISSPSPVPISPGHGVASKYRNSATPSSTSERTAHERPGPPVIT
jgi:DNA-binding FadR family transcriptional regulator